MSKVEWFNSVEDVFAEVNSRREAADARVTPWQKALTAGDCVLRYEPSADILVWGVLHNAVEAERGCGSDDDELEFVRTLYESPHMVGFRAGRHYSVIVPDGELGDIHVSTVLCKITQAQFEAARAAQWPAGGPVVLDILKLGETQPPRYEVFPECFGRPS